MLSETVLVYNYISIGPVFVYLSRFLLKFYIQLDILIILQDPFKSALIPLLKKYVSQIGEYKQPMVYLITAVLLHKT